MINGFSDSTRSVTQRKPQKQYGMSDAENAYQKPKENDCNPNHVELYQLFVDFRP